MKTPLMLFALLFMVVAGKAQDDLPTNDEERIQFKQGLFLSFDDFIRNSPVDFDQVEGDLQTFFENPMNSKELAITKNGSVTHVEQAAVWGYTDGKNVFLNRGLFKGMNINVVALKMKVTPWVKIQTIGTLSFISYFTMIEIRSLSMLQPQKNTTKSYFILNTKDGNFYDGNLKELKGLIGIDDSNLLAELEKTRGDKEVKFFMFLNKYNERHTLQFR
jgi:hypothetical protein